MTFRLSKVVAYLARSVYFFMIANSVVPDEMPHVHRGLHGLPKSFSCFARR